MVSDYTKYKPDQVYDDGAAFEAYLKFLDGKYTSESVLLGLMPLIYAIISRKFKGIQESHYDDLFGEAASKVWKAIENRNLPDSMPEVFYTYVIHAINSGVANALNRLDAPYTRLDVRKMPPVSSRFATVQQVDAKIFLEELPQLIRKKLVPTLRFSGKARQACEYILDRVLANKRVVRRMLVTRFGIENPDFYIEHIQIRLRFFLYDVRNAFTDLPYEGDYIDVGRLYSRIPNAK